MVIKYVPANKKIQSSLYAVIMLWMDRQTSVWVEE